MTALPMDVCASIFPLLDMDELLAAAQTCKAWRGRINATPSLWQHAHFRYKLSTDYVPIEDGMGHAVVARYKPNAAFVQERLQDRKVRSLFITADAEQVGYTQAGLHIDNFLARTIGMLYLGDSEERQALQLRLEGFRRERLIDLVKRITETRAIDQLDLGTWGEQSDGEYFATKILPFLDISSLRIYPKTIEPLPFLTGIAPLKNKPMIGESASQFGPQGLTSLAVYVTDPERPERCGKYCDEIMPSDLYISQGLCCLQLVGGRWNLKNTEDSVLHTLSCKEIWGLSNQSRRFNLHPFNNLVRFHLSLRAYSYDPAPPILWKDLITILRCTIGPTLEVLYLDLPESTTGLQQREYDDVWLERLEAAVNLQELTLVNYFPSTLKHLGSNHSKLIPSFRTLTLSGYQIYDDVLVSCLPKTLPNLEVFDLSTTSFHQRIPATSKEDWLQAWKSATSVTFRPPA